MAEKKFVIETVIAEEARVICTHLRFRVKGLVDRGNFYIPPGQMIPPNTEVETATCEIFVRRIGRAGGDPRCIIVAPHLQCPRGGEIKRQIRALNQQVDESLEEVDEEGH